MPITIRKLTPDLAEAYVAYFDNTPHDVNIDDHKCYCVTWRSDDSYSGRDGDHWFPSWEERRERALGYVKSGSLQGYLAFQEDKIVGWCNANANCGGCLNYLRSFWRIDETREDIKVKSVFCFMIAPEMQRKGIATQLLQRVCEDAKSEGFDFVEAYIDTNAKRIFDTSYEFMGNLHLYEKCGFKQHSNNDGRIVMRSALKK